MDPANSTSTNDKDNGVINITQTTSFNSLPWHTIKCHNQHQTTKMASNFSEIPILDLCLAANPSTKPQLLQELRHILLNVGFLYVKNHGVSEIAVKDLIDSLPTLFALPLEEKKSIALENSPRFLGYGGLGEEKTAVSRYPGSNISHLSCSMSRNIVSKVLCSIDILTLL